MNQPVPPTLTATKNSLGAGAVLSAGLAVAVTLLFCFDPAQYGFFPRCQFHELTGWLCPGCGSLRALHHLFHGEVLVAFHCNPLLVALLPLFVWLVVRRIFRRGPDRKFSRGFQFSQWTWGALAVIAAFTVLRNVPVPLFAGLRP